MQCKIFNRPDGGSVQRNVWTETSNEHTAGYGEVGEAGGKQMMGLVIGMEMMLMVDDNSHDG